MNTPHTPGPWTPICDRKRYKGISKMAMVATKHGSMSIDCTGSGASYDEDCANAALIAKAPIAPKLAEALRKARKVLKNRGGSTGYECLKEVNAALAEWDAQS